LIARTSQAGDRSHEYLARLRIGRSPLTDQQPRAIGNSEQQADGDERYRLLVDASEPKEWRTLE
jgi:hypothetical protein